MKLKAAALAVVTMFSATTASISQAGPNLVNCLSTDIIEFPGTVVDAALATPELSTLVDAVIAAGLVETLNEAEDITVYAPTNEAFAALPEGIVGAITSDTDVLTSVLTYHVSPGLFDPRRFVTPVRRQTLQGQTVFIHRANGDSRVNQAAINCQGVSTTNGIVWVINSVLIPAI